jgi:D-beta-D-heptose 7-phosphate kinase/D-beta-D-heptose 1-phosphate adenosyltransferase
MRERRSLLSLVDRLNSAMVACVGDIMLDRFVYGGVSRISPEAPIPVLRISSEEAMLGGLGNVVRNLSALECGIHVFSIAGEDAAGAEVEKLLQELPRCQAYLMREASRTTPVKIRYIAQGQQLLRADHETTEMAAPEVFEQALAYFRKHVDECSIVFLSDYAKGMLKGSYARCLIDIAREAGKPVVVDPKGRDFERYRNATVIKPNLQELGEATGMPVGSSAEQEAAARTLIRRTLAKYILVTRGHAGMLLVPHDRPCAEFAAVARDVYDVSGAGDTVAAVLSAALGSNVGIEQAVELANIAAGIVVGKVGTAVVDRSEIAHEIEHASAVAASGKIVRLSEAVKRVRLWQRMGWRVGFVQGDFDPLSSAHFEFLEQARSKCDRLVVGLRNAGARKERNEAFEDQHARAFLLGSLVYVDAVVIGAPQSAQEVISALMPDVLIPDPVQG